MKSQSQVIIGAGEYGVAAIDDALSRRQQSFRDDAKRHDAKLDQILTGRSKTLEFVKKTHFTEPAIFSSSPARSLTVWMSGSMFNGIEMSK